MPSFKRLARSIFFFIVIAGDFVVRVKLWNQNMKNSSNILRKRGDTKKTYEVIADHRCNTYNIEKVGACLLLELTMLELLFAFVSLIMGVHEL